MKFYKKLTLEEQIKRINQKSGVIKEGEEKNEFFSMPSGESPESGYIQEVCDECDEKEPTDKVKEEDVKILTKEEIIKNIKNKL